MQADSLLRSLIDEGKIPGLAIGVSQENDQQFLQGYGYANIESKLLIDPIRSLFRIASVSKPIAAMALARAVQDGIIDLDASFYDYVSYFPVKEFDFTIRHLASHTAGIRGYRGKEYGLNLPLSIKEGLGLFKDDPLQFPPGTSFLYNSYGWVMLSLAMEEVTGLPFSEYVREKILHPLNMLHTFPEDTKGRRKDQVNFYTSKGSNFVDSIPVNNTYKLAGGGYLSTVFDLIKLGKEILKPTLVSEEILREFLTSQIIKGNPTYYGLGWEVSIDRKNRKYYGHQGNGVGAYSNFFIYPNKNTTIAILINCTGPKIQKNLDTVIDQFL